LALAIPALLAAEAGLESSGIPPVDLFLVASALAALRASPRAAATAAGVLGVLRDGLSAEPVLLHPILYLGTVAALLGIRGTIYFGSFFSRAQVVTLTSLFGAIAADLLAHRGLFLAAPLRTLTLFAFGAAVAGLLSVPLGGFLPVLFGARRERFGRAW
jgi:hypothetical protein